MGGTVNRLQNTVDGVAQDLGDTMATITNMISNLQHDASGTLVNVANECLQSLRIITERADYTSFLLTNAVLAIAAAIALSILLYLTHFSVFLRAVVWTMYASLCLHMVLTYVRHSRSRPSLTSQQRESIQYQNQELEVTIAQSKDPLKINVIGRKLSDEDMRIVIKQAINNNQCTELRLISDQITSNGASILANTFFNNRTLELLSLWKNQVCDSGVQSLSNALSVNQSALKKLDLSENDITDEGTEHLAQMLKTNKILTHLTLSNNKINDRGVQLLADALQNRNNTLQVLSLTENKLINDASVDCLVNMIKRNQSLKKLWIDDCNLSEKGKDRLKRAAESKKDFQLHT